MKKILFPLTFTTLVTPASYCEPDLTGAFILIPRSLFLEVCHKLLLRCVHINTLLETNSAI